MTMFDNGALAWIMVRGGGKTQTSTGSVSIPPEVLSRYNAVNAQAQTVAQTPFQQYSTDPNAFVAPLDATQNAGVLGTNEYSSTAQPYYQQGSNTVGTGVGLEGQASGDISQGFGSLGSATGLAGNAASLTNAGSGAANAQQLTPGYINQFENPYAQDVIQPTSQLMEQQFNQAQSGQLGNAINNGAFGGDRAAITAANLQQQQGLAYGQTIGGLEGQMYNTALTTAGQQQGVNLGAQQANLARLQQAGQGLNTIAGTEAGIGAGYGSLGSQVGAIGTNYGNLGTTQGNLGSGAQAAGLSGAQAQMAAGQAQQQTEQADLTALYDQFLQQQSYPFQTTQFLGNLAEGTGALSGSNTSATSPAPFFSDERLKTDIEPIGKTFDGQNIVRFRYKDEPHKRIGLVAQDVERKHPDAVGLAGGYKTVDYDAATSDAAAAGRTRKASGGGLVPFALDRRAYAYGGLSPNSAWDAGFYVDPSYLSAQEQGYASAPWGNAGPVAGSSPYGGRSHVPPSAGSGAHGALAVAKLPPPSNSNTLKQVSQGLGDVEKLGTQGKALYQGAQGVMGGLSPSSPAAAAPAATQTAPAAALGAVPGAAIPTSDAMAAAGSDMATAGAFFGRGGLARDGGGFVDASTDDQSAGGDIPYDSGTGQGGMDIPDDRNTRSLQVAQPLSNSGSNSGLGNVASDAGDALKLATMIIPFLSRGGLVPRRARADGGISDMPLPDMAAGDDPSWNQPPKKNSSGLIPPTATAQVPSAVPTQVAQADIPSQTMTDASPSDGGGLMGGLRGIYDTAQKPEVQGLLMPLLHGLGTMASSNSRYLGSAVLQGLGGAADSYENVQNEMMERGLAAPVAQQRNIETNSMLYQNWMRTNAYRQNQGLPPLSLDDYQKQALGTGQATGPGVAPSAPKPAPMSGTSMHPAPAPNGAQPNAGGGQGGFSYSPQELQSGTVNRGGQTVPLNQDEAYLRGYVLHNSLMAHDPVLGPGVEFAKNQLQNIQAQSPTQRIITGTNGQPMLQPGAADAARASALPAMQVANAQDFIKERQEFNKNYAQTQSLLNGLQNIYTRYQAGSPGTAIKPALSNLSRMIDPSGKLDLFANAGGDYDQAVKDATMLTMQRLGATVGSSSAPAAEMESLNKYAGMPTLQPSALKDVVARGKAALAFSQEMYNGYNYEKNPDVGAYLNDFNSSHNYENNYYKKELLTEPRFAGEPPPNLTNPSDLSYLKSGDTYHRPDDPPGVFRRKP